MNPYSSKSNHSKHRTYRARKKWINNNPPDANGNYTCALCNKPVPAGQMTLDHIKERALLKHDSEYYHLWNLQPTHESCNYKKAREFTIKYKQQLAERQATVLRHRPRPLTN